MRIPEKIYEVIRRVMPIPCVDLVIRNHEGDVLLVRRNNEPALGQWWFPGGRIHFGETLEVAARRKLADECGLQALRVEQLWTRDVILSVDGDDTRMSHGITTLFALTVPSSAQVKLDSQAGAFAWKTPPAWKKEPLHRFVSQTLDDVANDLGCRRLLEAP